MRREKMMSLRTHVSYARNHGFGNLALQREVILLGILCLQMRCKFPEQQNWAERSPVNAAWRASRTRTRRGRSLIDHAGERIRCLLPALGNKRRIEKCGGQR